MKARKCEFCGKKIGKDDLFCTSCGNEIKKEKEVKDAVVISSEKRTKEDNTFIMTLIIILLIIIIAFGLYHLIF